MRTGNRQIRETFRAKRRWRACSDALFFIRLDSLEKIDNMEGSGTVQPASTADIHWLIIPASGAATGLAQGSKKGGTRIGKAAKIDR